MTYSVDLAPLSYLGPNSGNVLGVGWLEVEHAYPQGDVSAAVMPALEQLLIHGWEPVSARGWHDCSLCNRQPKDGPIMREVAGKQHMLGARNLFVPAPEEGVMYAVPSLIIHYIEDHHYQPPAPFLAALTALDTTSPDYPLTCQQLWSGA